MEEVAAGIYRIEAEIPKVDSVFAVYLIREGKGAIIEPGPTAILPAILEAMQRLGMKEAGYIIPTHIHLDHAGAAGNLSRLFPQAKVMVHPKGAKHLIDPSRLIESSRMAFGDDFEVLYGPILPVAESQVKTPEDGEVLAINDRKLRFIYAPGHAPHHMAILDEKTMGLFSGEALGAPLRGAASSPIPMAAPPSFDIEVSLETMERLRQLRPRLLFYSHDGVGTRPDELISAAEENTRVFGDIILKSLQAGQSRPEITREIREHISRNLGVSGEGVELWMIVAGFIAYFQKKGLA